MLNTATQPSAAQVADEFKVDPLEPRNEMLSPYGHDKEVSHPDGYPLGEDLPADC